MTTIISSVKHTHKPGSLVNIAVIAALLLAAVPAVIFGIMQILPPLDTSVKTAAVDETPKRSSTAERRAQRREAREAARKTQQTATVETYTVNTAPGFGPDMNGFGGGFAPDMNGFGGGFAPDMNGFGGGFGGGFGPDMGGFGGGFAPGMNGFGGFGPGMGGFGGFGDIGELPGDRV